MKKIKKAIVIAITILIFLFSCALYLLPILHAIPKSNGPSSVGIKTFVWQDFRHNILEKEYDRIIVDIYYPTKPKNKTYVYQPGMINALIEVRGMRNLLKKAVWKILLTGVKSYTEQNADLLVSDLSYPIIIFLPGIGGINLYETYLADLASNGYIVAAITPPGDTMITSFPNGSLQFLDSELANASKKQNREQIYAYRNQAHVRWKKYVDFVVKQLRILGKNNNSIFFNQIDFSKIGLLGHSHGGAVVTDLCQHDQKWNAGVNMEGWTKTYNTREKVGAPFLLLGGDDFQMSEMQSFFENNKSNVFFHSEIIQGATHLSFSDLILLKIPFLGLFDVISWRNMFEAKKIRQNISNELVNFFDRYLK